jgi:hypothetical protein
VENKRESLGFDITNPSQKSNRPSPRRSKSQLKHGSEDIESGLEFEDLDSSISGSNDFEKAKKHIFQKLSERQSHIQSFQNSVIDEKSPRD